MHDKPRFSPIHTGIAVSVAMLLIIAGIMVSGIPGGPKIGLPWSSSFTVKAQLPDADSLAPKAGVQIAGVKIGEVHSVDLQGQQGIVTMDIYPQYQELHNDGRV